MERQKYHERAIRVLECCVGGQDRVIRLNNRTRELWSRVHAKLEFRLLSIICRQLLQQKSSKARASSSAKGMEDKKALQTRAVIGEPP